jgi:ribosomal protein S18 acetylase RimI-like enzyme
LDSIARKRRNVHARAQAASLATGKNMQIAVYQDENQQGVITLWQRCNLLRSWNDPAKDIARKQQVQPELFLVGFEAGRLIASAMAGFDGHRGNVYYLAVDPDFQGHGFGRALMSAVEELLLACGCPKVNIMIRSSNLDVQHFYETIGYSPVDVLCMGKRLVADD